MTLQLDGHRIEAAVFDVDGVLADTAAGWSRAEAALREHYGVRYTAPTPTPDVYEEAARRLGAAPEHTLAVEDSPTGGAAAHAAGGVVVSTPTTSTVSTRPVDHRLDDLSHPRERQARP